MKRYSPQLMLVAFALVALSSSIVITGCSHSSSSSGDSNGVIASNLDCSDEAIAKSDHPFQLQQDCESARDARERAFKKTHDCRMDVVIQQPNPDEYEANCQGEVWNGKPDRAIRDYMALKAHQATQQKVDTAKKAVADEKRAEATRKFEDSCIPEMVKPKVLASTYRRCEPMNQGKYLFNLDTDMVPNDQQQEWIKRAANRKGGSQ